MAGTRSRIYKKMWEDHREKLRRVTSTGCCYVMRSSGRIQVAVPDDDSVFVTHAVLLLGARYRPKTGVWSFEGDKWVKVLALCHSIYGENKTVVKGAQNESAQPV